MNIRPFPITEPHHDLKKVQNDLVERGYLIDQYTLHSGTLENDAGEITCQAQHMGTGRKVILKFLKTYNPQFLSRILSINHPNLRRVIDTGSREFPYLVLEEVDGLPLLEYSKRGTLGFERRLSLFLSLCSAIAYLHEHLISTGPLFSERVLAVDAKPDVLVVFDRNMVDSSEGMQHEATLPDTRGQIRELGVFLEQLLHHALPKKDKKRINSDLKAIIAKATDKERGLRYSSVGHLVEDIERLLTNKPVTAQPMTKWYIMGRFFRRNRLWLTPVLFLLFILIAVLSFFIWMGAGYYITTLNRTIIVRWGRPGFEKLPVVGAIAVETDFTLNHTRNPQNLNTGALVGFWPLMRGGMLPWGPRLLAQLSHAEAGLNHWRMGQPEEAFRRLAQGINDEVPEAAWACGYIALQSKERPGDAPELLNTALTKKEAVHNQAVLALEVLRDTHPTAIIPFRENLAMRFSQEPALAGVASAEALAILGAHEDPAVSRAIGYLAAKAGETAGSQAQANAVRALKHLPLRKPELGSDILAALHAGSIKGVRPQNQTVAFPADLDFDTKPHSDAEFARLIPGILSEDPEHRAEALKRVVQLTERRIALTEALKPLLSLNSTNESHPIEKVENALWNVLLEDKRPSPRRQHALIQRWVQMDTSVFRIAAIRLASLCIQNGQDSSTDFSAKLWSLVEDPDNAVRINALRALKKFSETTAEKQRICDFLARVVKLDRDSQFRKSAVSMLAEMIDIDPAGSLPAITWAAGDEDTNIRMTTIAVLGELGLNRKIDMTYIEPILHRGLEDTNISVRQESAQALLLSSERIQGDLNNALDEFALTFQGESGWRMGDELSLKFAHADPHATSRVARDLISRARQVRGPALCLFLSNLTEKQPHLLSDITVALTEFIASGDNPKYAQQMLDYLFALKTKAPTEDVEQALTKLLPLLTGRQPQRKIATIKLLAIMGTKNNNLSHQIGATLAPMIMDSREEVIETAADALGLLGEVRPESVIHALPLLFERMKMGSDREKKACTLAVLKIFAQGSPSPTAVMNPLVALLNNENPDVRVGAGRCLAQVVMSAPNLKQRIITLVQQQFAVESDEQVRIWLAGSLGKIGGEHPEIASQVFDYADGLLKKSQISEDFLQIPVQMARTHPQHAEKAILTLARGLEKPDVNPALGFFWLKVFASQSEKEARVVLSVLSTFLEGDDPNLRQITLWYLETILKNIHEKQLLSPSEIDAFLLRCLKNTKLLEPNPVRPFQVDTIWGLRTEAMLPAVLKKPESLRPLLISSNRRERKVGRQLACRILVERPELGSFFHALADDLRADPHPHIRLSASLLRELVVCLELDKNFTDSVDAAQRRHAFLRNSHLTGFDERHQLLDTIEKQRTWKAAK